MVDAIMMHHQLCKQGFPCFELEFTYNHVVTIHNIVNNHVQGKKNGFAFTPVHKHTKLFLDPPAFSNTKLSSD